MREGSSNSRAARRALPIFVIGCQRSGTSLLRRILDSHPRIACPSESAFLVQHARVFEIERSRQGLLHLGFTEREILDRMRDFTAGFLEAYARRRGKPRWAEKTTHHVNHLDTIERMFDGEVLYVSIVRHGLDVASSLAETDWGVIAPYLEAESTREVACARFWSDQSRKILDFAPRVPGRLFELRYERLTRDPEDALRPLFAFLDEDWDPGVIDYARVPHDGGFEDPKIEEFQEITPNSGRFLRWPRELRERAFDAAREMLERLGYGLETADPKTPEARPTEPEREGKTWSRST